MAATNDEIESAIRDAAERGIQSASNQLGSMSEHSLNDRLDAHARLKRNDAAAYKHRGIRFTQIVPPGSQA